MPKKKPLPQPPFWLLSIDPAKEAGWCLFEMGKPLRWGTADGSTWKGLVKELYEVQGLLHRTATSFESRECVIEDGFFQYGKQTFKGTLTLGRRRGLAQAAAESVGIDKFTYIAPSTWQNGLGWRRGIDTKTWSLSYVKARYGLDNISHDTADAIALGAYHLDSYKKPA